MVAAGLVLHGRRGRLLDRFRDRLMFPLRDAGGDVVGFTGRNLGAGPHAPKYLNSPATPLYRKSAVLYGLAEQQRQLSNPRTRRLIVEGSRSPRCSRIPFRPPWPSPPAARR